MESFNIIHCVIDTLLVYCILYIISIAYSGLPLSQDFLLCLTLSGLGKLLRIIMINNVFLTKIRVKSGLFY